MSIIFSLLFISLSILAVTSNDKSYYKIRIIYYKHIKKLYYEKNNN